MRTGCRKSFQLAVETALTLYAIMRDLSPIFLIEKWLAASQNRTDEWGKVSVMSRFHD